MVYTGVFCRTNYLTNELCHCFLTTTTSASKRSKSSKSCKLFPYKSPVSLSTVTLLIIINITLVSHWCLVDALSTHSEPFVPNAIPLNRYSLSKFWPGRTIAARRIPRNSSVTFVDEPEKKPLKVIGFRLEGAANYIIESDEEYVIKANTEVQMRLFGINLNSYRFYIGFSTSVDTGGTCFPSKKFLTKHVDNYTSIVSFSLPADSDQNAYIVCYSLDSNGSVFEFISQESWFRIRSESPFVPLWLQLVMIAILLLMSGLFSGLNLGLMALDKNELQVIERCGTVQEKTFAKSIAPVRKRGNYLLCTLLLGNVLVNSTLTIFLDELTSGIFAVVTSTLSIVIFGEIIPQALCSRHGLAVGAKTIYITYLFMLLTFPLSYPISKLLDKILGEEIGSVYDRERLMEYIRITKDYNNLGADEMNIISGALKFKKIMVSAVMTPIGDVFMLPYDSVLNFETMTLINNSGYSRIPIYESDRNNVVGILHIKDLSLIDADHNLPIKALLDFFSHPLIKVHDDETLDQMLNIFKEGKSHMALVRSVIDDGVNDPYYQLIGVVTLEDVIEELIQAEINDETDVISDNRRKQKRKEVQSRSNYLDFIRCDMPHQNVLISPQLALASYRFLVSFVEPFRPVYISEDVLKTLMTRDIYFEAKGEKRKANIKEMSEENVLYIREEPANYFIMILEGRARIMVTKENQEYDAGPFCCFGINALLNSTNSTANLEVNLENQRSRSYSQVDDYDIQHFSSLNSAQSPVNYGQEGSNLNVNQNVEPFVPDFSLFCIEKTIYLKVTRELYQKAVQTSVIRKHRTSSMNKSLSGVTINTEQDDCDVLVPLESQSRKRKISSYLDAGKIRKISLSTNLPESSLIDVDGDDKLFNSIDERKPSMLLEAITTSEDNLKRRSQIESVLRRSNALDLLSECENRTSIVPTEAKQGNNTDEQKSVPKHASGNGQIVKSGDDTDSNKRVDCENSSFDETIPLY